MGWSFPLTNIVSRWLKPPTRNVLFTWYFHDRITIPSWRAYKIHVILLIFSQKAQSCPEEKCGVHLNGEKLDIKNFRDYCDLYLPFWACLKHGFPSAKTCWSSCIWWSWWGPFSHKVASWAYSYISYIPHKPSINHHSSNKFTIINMVYQR